MYWIFATIILLFLFSMFGAVCVVYAKRVHDCKSGWMIFLERDCYRAVVMYWRLSEVRAGRMSYERFLNEYNSVYGYCYDKQPGESPFDYQERLHKTSLYRELANHHRDLVEKYMMGPQFRYDVEYKNLMAELKRSIPVNDFDIDEDSSVSVSDVTNLSQQDARVNNYTVPGSTKRKYTTFSDLLTESAPENTISRMSKYFSVKRKGLEVGLTQCCLEDNGYIHPVDRKTYVELAKAEFGITLSYTSISEGVKGVNRDDYSDEAREIMQTFEEYLTRDDLK